MSSLFVTEEPENEVQVKLEPGVADVTVKTEPVVEEDVVMEDNESLVKFYNIEEEVSDDEDDPIVNTIPVHLKGDSTDSKLSPLLLQFANKSKSSSLNKSNLSNISKLNLKAESGIIELNLPIDSNKFFNETLSAKFNNVQEQFLRGVIIHDEPKGSVNEGNVPSISIINNNEQSVKEEKAKGASASSIRTQPGTVGGSRYLIGIQDNEGKLNLIPISDTCMLRPHFSYIDNAKMRKIEKERERERELTKEKDEKDNDVKKNASVVTMSAKSTKENLPRLGGALMSNKLEIEEEGREFNVLQINNDFINANLIEKSGNVLKCTMTQEEYLDLLLEQTKN